jgi:small-conductance mechanosensitive channel
MEVQEKPLAMERKANQEWSVQQDQQEDLDSLGRKDHQDLQDKLPQKQDHLANQDPRARLERQVQRANRDQMAKIRMGHQANQVTTVIKDQPANQDPLEPRVLKVRPAMKVAADTAHHHVCPRAIRLIRRDFK